ncbi:methyltransferase [Candidatus Woesearchaeota archaeon]|nr:methyltransferase [Candidatus Woesearchaeota archaeon]
MITSRARLAIELSKLKAFEHPDHLTEQYMTDSEIASEILWSAYYAGDIENKIVADLGCGTGILGIGALLLRAKKVYFVDADEHALAVLRDNLQSVDTGVSTPVIMQGDVGEFKEKVDTVLQNPPFGTRTKHADRDFLLKAFQVSRTIYTFHKTTSKDFIASIANDNQFKIANYFEFGFPIKATQLFHHQRIHRIKVGCWLLRKADVASFEKPAPS